MIITSTLNSAIMTYKIKTFSYRIKIKFQVNKTSLLKQMGRKIIFFILKTFILKSSKKSQNDEKTKQKTQKFATMLKSQKLFSIIKN